MIYLDTSVALAHLLAEDRQPPESLWQQALVSSRLLEPFPVSVRTLGALHLASVEFLRGRGVAVELATYDERLTAGAESIDIPLAAV